MEASAWHAPVLFLSLAVVDTWPLAPGLADRSRIHDDAWLNAWAVSWVVRKIFTDPWHLFDANMFHSHQGALAYTEPLIAPALLAAPIRWFGGSALLAHNLLVLLGFTLTALAVYVLVTNLDPRPPREPALGRAVRVQHRVPDACGASAGAARVLVAARAALLSPAAHAASQHGRRVARAVPDLLHAPLSVQHRWLCSVLRGHYLYCGLPSNWYPMSGFYQELRRGWYRALRRRSQRRLTWPRFQQLLERFPLPSPSITHPRPARA